MSRGKVILVTGVAGYWGAQLAGELLGRRNYEGGADWHIIGLDTNIPDPEIQGLDFIQADIRNSLLVDLLQEEQVDTLCHLAFVDSVRPVESAFDANVIGTMKVLGACAQAGVRKVVLKSSTAVYGAHPDNPAFITEEHPLQGSRKYGYTRDLVEVEAFYNGFRRQVPEMVLALLRFANIVGITADTPMTRFLSEPLSPVLMGFDPMMQIIHERDVVDALVHAVVNDAHGAFNIAAEGVLPLSKLMAIAGKIQLPVVHPLAYCGVGVLDRIGFRSGRFLPIELDYLRYPWVGDLSKMREEFGFAPRYTAEEALREFAGQQRMQRFMPESAALAYDEQRLRDTLERRRRMRTRQAMSTAGDFEETGYE
jgi:UDP-glucose 4-epimerase